MTMMHSMRVPCPTNKPVEKAYFKVKELNQIYFHSLPSPTYHHYLPMEKQIVSHFCHTTIQSRTNEVHATIKIH